MTHPRLTINYRVLRDEGDTIVITPINDEIRIKKPGPVKVNQTLTATIKESDLTPVGDRPRPSYFNQP